MHKIEIKIENKRATAEGSPVIVCGNKDYWIEFSFDGEWEPEGLKTARFVYLQDGEVKYTDVPFTGSAVTVPVLSNIKEVMLGVFADDIRTTTPARIPCELSIRCGTGAPADPTPSQYDQIIALLNATPGKSAYDIAKEHGFEGTEEEWLESLRGEPGPQGPQGPVGPAGSGDGTDFMNTEFPEEALGKFVYINPSTTKPGFRTLDNSYFKVTDTGIQLTPVTGLIRLTKDVHSALALGRTIINVESLGAIGDDETDNSVALQAAFDSCRVGGGIVFFPKGTYLIGNALGTNQYVEFYSNTHILGEPGTVLKFHPSVADVINSGTNNDTQVQPISLLRNHTDNTMGGYTATENVVIENLIFDCNADFAKKSTTVGLGHARDIILKNCHFINGKSSDLSHHHYLEINGCRDVKVINCSFKRSLSPSTNGNSEMVNIDRAIDGAYGYNTYYLGDGTTCDNIEIAGCKFKTYPKAEVPSGYYVSPAIGGHDSNTTGSNIKIHDCQFEGDWITNGQERQWVIRLFGDYTCSKVYNNTFKASTADLTSKTIGISLQGTKKTNMVYNNIFVDYDSAKFIAANNDKEKNCIRFNNYLFTTSSGSVVTDSATMNLNNGVLSLG